MMNELEMRADEYKHQRIQEKAEQVICETTERFITDFFKAYCFIMNQCRVMDPDQVDQDIERHDLARKLNGIAASSLESMQYAFYLKMIGFLDESQRIINRVFSSGKPPEIYRNYLDGNILLPKSSEWTETFENDYSRLALVPGEDEMTIEEMTSWSFDFMPIKSEELGENDIRETEKRPKKFYTIGLSDWSKPDKMIKFDDFHNNAEKLKKEMKEINPLISGMTERDYIWARLCDSSGLAKLNLRGDLKSGDSDYASLLLGDKISKADGGLGYRAAWLEGRWPTTLKITTSNGALSSFPRFVMVFGGQDER